MNLDKRVSKLEDKLIKPKPTPIKIIRVFIDPSDQLK
jgi:hypothetical protein